MREILGCFKPNQNKNVQVLKIKTQKIKKVYVAKFVNSAWLNKTFNIFKYLKKKYEQKMTSIANSVNLNWVSEAIYSVIIVLLAR